MKKTITAIYKSYSQKAILTCITILFSIRMVNAQYVYITSAKNSTSCVGETVLFTAHPSGFSTYSCSDHDPETLTYNWSLNNSPLNALGQTLSLQNEFLVGLNVISCDVIATYNCYTTIVTGGGPQRVRAGFGQFFYGTVYYYNNVYANHPNLVIQPVTPPPYVSNKPYDFYIPTTSVPNLQYTWNVDALFGNITTISTDKTRITVQTATTFTSTPVNISVNSLNTVCLSSLDSPSLMVTSINTPPVQPTVPTVVSSTDQYSVNLSWGVSSDNTITVATADNNSVKYYIVNYTDVNDNTKNGSFTYVVTSSDLTSKTITTRVDGLVQPIDADHPQSYTFSVIAQDNEGANSIASQTSSPPYIIDHMAPPDPTAVHQIEETDNTATFTWNQTPDNVGVKGYNVYKDNIKIASIGVSNVYTIPYTSIPSTPVYKIEAFDEKGNFSSRIAFPQITQELDPFVIDPVTSFVGIGVNPPSEKLDVDGNLKVRGDIIMDKFDKTKSNVITFTGTSLDIYTPSQGVYNGQKPIISMTQWGEIKFNSSPYMNYNDIKFLGTGNYINGVGYRTDFGGKTGINGPVLFGDGGGALGSKQGSWDGPEKTALIWDKDNRTTLTGTVIVQGGIDGTLNRFGTADANGNYVGPVTNFNYNGKITSGGRMVLQEHMTPGDANALSNWGRMLLSNNIEWDATLKKYHTLDQGANADLQMLRYENHGGMAFYTRNQFSSFLTPNEPLPEFIDQTTLDQKYRRMSITGHGTVVIGNQATDVIEVVNAANQNDKLRVYGDTKLNGDLYINDIKQENFWARTQGISGSGGVNINFSAGGNVGIGTGLADEKLHVVGNIRIQGTSNVNYLMFPDGTRQYSAAIPAVWQINSGFTTTYVNSGVNVGIGVAAATSPLDIAGITGSNAINVRSGNLKVTDNIIVKDINASGNIKALNINSTGIISTTEVRICLTPSSGCPDYVFEEHYKLRSLDEVEKYVKENKHLPDVYSAKELENNGMGIKEMNFALLRKVEELTLYTIELKKELEIIKKKIK